MAEVTRRVAHVERFYGKDESTDGGPDNSDLWIDVEVIDEITIESGRGFDYQKKIYKFKYEDGDNKSRRTKDKKVTFPDDDTKYVIIPVTVRITTEGGRWNDYQKTIHKFDNTDQNNSRIVRTKRVYNNDIDDRFLDDDRKPPKDPEQYLNAVRITNRQDRGQFLDVEVIQKFRRETGRGFKYQKTIISLAQKVDPLMREPLIDE